MSLAQELERLDDLHRRGVLSDDEFARAKARVLEQAGGAPAGGAYRSDSAGGNGSGSGLVDAVHALRRARRDRWLGGVCGGLAPATGLPSWLIRVLFTLGVLCGGTGILIYLLMWIFVPEEPQGGPRIA